MTEHAHGRQSTPTHTHTCPHTPIHHTRPHTPTHAHTRPHTPTHAHTRPHTPTHAQALFKKIFTTLYGFVDNFLRRLFRRLCLQFFAAAF
jgi:hypothetical protein